MGVIVVGCAVLSAALRSQAGWLATVLWLWAGIPRLHDIGRSGWWAVGVLAFVAGAVAAASTVGALMVPPMRYLGVRLEAALILWLGVAEGEAVENRFGPPPGRRARGSLLAS
jgi:uncharacterized membrane protein YhaH (DUF805 family)